MRNADDVIFSRAIARRIFSFVLGDPVRPDQQTTADRTRQTDAPQHCPFSHLLFAHHQDLDHSDERATPISTVRNLRHKIQGLNHENPRWG